MKWNEESHLMTKIKKKNFQKPTFLQRQSIEFHQVADLLHGKNFTIDHNFSLFTLISYFKTNPRQKKSEKRKNKKEKYKQKNPRSLLGFVLFGAGERFRTSTWLPKRDFESRASAVPPHQLVETKQSLA